MDFLTASRLMDDGYDDLLLATLDHTLVTMDGGSLSKVDPDAVMMDSPPAIDLSDAFECIGDTTPATLVLKSEAMGTISSKNPGYLMSGAAHTVTSSIDALLFEDDGFDLPMLTVHSTISPESLKPKPNKTRYKRRKDELIYLRAQVEELQTQLLQLQFENSKRSTINAVAATVSQAIETFWKEIATQSQQEVIEATRVNMKLRTMLERQLQVIQQLQTALLIGQQRLGDELHHGLTLCGRTTTYSDMIAFSKLGHNLTMRFHETDAVLSSWSGASFNKGIVTPQVRQIGRCFEVFDSQIVPCSLAVLGTAWWHAITQASIRLNDNAVYEVHHISDDGVYARYTDILRSSNYQATMHARIKMQRFVVADRIVIVSDSLMEIGAPLSVHFRETKWQSFVASSDFESTVQLCIRGSPELSTPDCTKTDDQQQQQDEEIQVITNFINSTLRQRMQMMDEIVGHMLELHKVCTARICSEYVAHDATAHSLQNIITANSNR